MKTQLDDFCRVLVKTGALKFGLFTLSGGKLSPYYLDLRILPSFPDAFQKSVELLVENAKKIVGVDKIAGIPTGGLPWASVLAFSLSKPLVYTRKDVKTHGRERKVEGVLSPGDRVLLIDDVITTGKNTTTALQSLRGEGGVVEHALVLLDREEGGKSHLEASGVELHSVVRISEVAQKLLDMDAITKTQYGELTGQHDSGEA
ncbi:MAG TPA: orotate phosphoribosyltransferase [Candidatus Bathyarchaeia archaeon]